MTYQQGNYYIADSGTLMYYDGSKWISKGPFDKPDNNSIVTNQANKVAPPGSKPNPSAPQGGNPNLGQGAYQQATPGEDPTKRELGKFSIKPPKVNAEGGTSLRYPYDRSISAGSDYIVFEFWKYNPPFGRDDTGNTGTSTTSSGTPSYKTYNASVDDLTQAKDPANPEKNLPPILLYIPEDVQTQYGQKWGGAAFGSVTAGMLQAIGTSANAETFLDDIPGVVKSKTFDLLRQGINKVAGASVSENQALGGVSGTILNPNTEMMYDGPELRTLDLTFKMVAGSDREAQEIKKICNTFKKAMLPTFGGQTSSFGGSTSGFGGGNLITIPSICTIKYMYGSSLHPYLPQYKACAIANVAINYTPDGSYATYENGSPVATQLRISLKEMKNIFSSEINDQGASY